MQIETIELHCQALIDICKKMGEQNMFPSSLILSEDRKTLTIIFKHIQI